MKIIEVHCTRWFLPKRATGITLYPFIFYQKSKFDIILRRHEWIHIRQVRRDGWFKFYYTWIKENHQMGYYDIEYEKEAYFLEEREAYNPWRMEKPIVLFADKNLLKRH